MIPNEDRRAFLAATAHPPTVDEAREIARLA